MLSNAVRHPHHITKNIYIRTNFVIVCGNAISNGGGPAPGGISDCNMLCAGNSSEYCGAGNRLDVYQATGTGGSSGTTTAPAATTTAPSGPQHEAKVGAYTWAGCYTEATNERALTGSSDINYNTMTVEICAAFCASYTIFGVEYSKCFSPNSEKLC
jgi:WSC domain